MNADTNHASDQAKLLSQDVVLLLKHFCFRLTAGPRWVENKIVSHFNVENTEKESKNV